MTFAKRELSSGVTLGVRLQQLRQENQASTADIAAATKIAEKYIIALEAGRYNALPGQVYARSFVRQYAEYVGLHLESAMQRFDEEYALIAKTAQPTTPLPPTRVNTEHHWMRRHARLLLASIVILIVTGYVGWQAGRLFLPPRLLVTEPAANLTIKESQVRVSGQTEPNVTVAINNQPVAVNASGQFSEVIDVSPGLNTLEITAKKKNSGERVVVRQVLVENPSE